MVLASTSKLERGLTIRAAKKFFREPPPRPEHRVNERIRLSPVRVVDSSGDQIGVLPVDEAIDHAKAAGMDLVEVAPRARPPVCKIMDYGRFQYEMDKKERRSKQQQSRIDVKQVKLRPAIDDHDLETKIGRARRFLRQGKHVKLTIMFRRRELRRPENGYELLERASEALSDVASITQPPPPILEGRDLSMVVKPA